MLRSSKGSIRVDWLLRWILIWILGVGVTASGTKTWAAPAPDLEVVVGSTGVLSQWQVLGPFRLPARGPGRGRGQVTKVPRLSLLPKGLVGGVAELDPGRAVTVRERRRSRSQTWRLVTGNEPIMDLRRGLRLKGYQRYRVAFLGLVIHAAKPSRAYLSVGHDDGLAVWLNGRRVFASLASQSYRRDQRLLALDLVKGRNRLVLHLAHSRGRWRVQTRLTGATHRPLGHGAAARRMRLLLPGPGPSAKRFNVQAAKALNVGLGRTFTPSRLTFDLTVTAPGGVVLPPGGHLTLSYGIAWQRGRRHKGLFPVRVDLRRVAERGRKVALSPRSLALGRRAARWLVVYSPGARAVWHRLWRADRACVRLTSAAKDLTTARKRTPPPPAASLASVAYHLKDLRRLILGGDTDATYLARRLRTVARWAAALAKGTDPFPRLHGRIVKAYRSRLNGSLQPYSLYVPPGHRRRRSWPLYVMLHGMNCNHRKGLHQMLGTWMPKESALPWWRFVRRPPPAKVYPRALVLSPQAFGNSFYRHAGEVAVHRAIAEVVRHYRVDPQRVILVGHSMGGTGVLDLGLRAPHRFAGMVSLAGYPSRWIHGDIRRGPLRSWEKHQAKRYSPQYWVENGRHLPLIAVHGSKDGPYKSKGVVRAYKRLRYKADLKLFEFGHSVWRKYLDRGQVFTDTAAWRTPKRPGRVSFATTGLRWNRAHWVRMDARPRSDAWSRVDARMGAGSLRVKTQNLDQLTLLLDRAPVRRRKTLGLRIDQTKMTVPGRGMVTVHRKGGVWHLGARPAGTGLRKRPGLEGPMEDLYHGPVLVVFGTGSPRQRAALERVARRLTTPGGASIRYPMKADTRVTAADRRRYHLVLVGGANVNRETARYAKRLPIRITARGVTLGRCRFTGPDLGVKFVYPNPDVSGRYLLVIAGTTARGVLRQHLVPRYLPDFVVYDASMERTGSARILGPNRRYLAAGTFDRRWRLPANPCPPSPGRRRSAAPPRRP